MEIGCGTGYVLSGLSASTDFQLSGSDIHVEGLKYAKQRVPSAEFIQMDATEMPFETEFDAIGAFDVLEHISDDELALKNIHKSLCQKESYTSVYLNICLCGHHSMKFLFINAGIPKQNLFLRFRQRDLKLNIVEVLFLAFFR